ncbi:MAG: hypothetical protein K2N56_02610 [Oscillospiraceae bacterium]|nr:hypothetical protein [Oscillospiraceae bacterium]
MKNFFNNIRSDRNKIPVWKFILFCVVFLVLGAAVGAVSKIADVYWEILSDVTSGICFWIFICVVICAFSKNPFRAAAYVFLFCAAMVAVYYPTADIMRSMGIVSYAVRYGKSYVRDWSIVAAVSPICAFFTWYAFGKGAFSWMIRIGIIVVMAAGMFLLPGLMLFDVLFILGTIIGYDHRDQEKRREKRQCRLTV